MIARARSNLESATMSDKEQIAWLALEKGAPVFASDGRQVGKVVEVLADEQRDIFSGISFRSNLLDEEKFVTADAVGQITTAGVTLAVPFEDAEDLPPPAG